jgi:hypothetical protein
MLVSFSFVQVNFLDVKIYMNALSICSNLISPRATHQSYADPTLVLRSPGSIQINEITEKEEIMVPEVGIEIEGFTLVKDVLRGPRRIQC